MQLGVIGMELLLALDASASYGYTVWETLVESTVYYLSEAFEVLI